MKRTTLLNMAVVVILLLAVVPVFADPPGLVLGNVDGSMYQDMKNYSFSSDDFNYNYNKGIQQADFSGFLDGGPKDKVKVKMMEQQSVAHFQEQISPDYNSAIGGLVEQNLDISGTLRRSGNFDLYAWSNEETQVNLGHYGNQMYSNLNSLTVEGFMGDINGTGKIEANLSTTKYQGYYQEAINPDSYSLHFGQLNESVVLNGVLKVRECDPSIFGTAFTNTNANTNTYSFTTPTTNTAIANQSVRSTAGIIGGLGVTGEVKVNTVNGYEQISQNPTSQIKQSGISEIKINIKK